MVFQDKFKVTQRILSTIQLYDNSSTAEFSQSWRYRSRHRSQVRRYLAEQPPCPPTGRSLGTHWGLPNHPCWCPYCGKYRAPRPEGDVSAHPAIHKRPWTHPALYNLRYKHTSARHLTSITLNIPASYLKGSLNNSKASLNSSNVINLRLTCNTGYYYF